MSRATIKQAVFVQCKLDMANFRFSTLEHVMFIQCQLVEADFQGAALRNVLFDACRIERAEFAKCSLSTVDARSSELIDVRGWEYLKGLTVDAVQLPAIAPQLAAALGLHVVDD